MKRDALAAFFRRAVIAALPLASACGGGLPITTPDAAADMVVLGRFCGNPWTVDGGVDDGGCFEKCAETGHATTGFCHEDTNSSGGAVTVCSPDCTGRRFPSNARSRYRIVTTKQQGKEG